MAIYMEERDLENKNIIIPLLGWMKIWSLQLFEKDLFSSQVIH